MTSTAHQTSTTIRTEALTARASIPVPLDLPLPRRVHGLIFGRPATDAETERHGSWVQEPPVITFDLDRSYNWQDVPAGVDAARQAGPPALYRDRDGYADPIRTVRALHRAEIASRIEVSVNGVLWRGRFTVSAPRYGTSPWVDTRGLSRNGAALDDTRPSPAASAALDAIGTELWHRYATDDRLAAAWALRVQSYADRVAEEAGKWATLSVFADEAALSAANASVQS